jgi:hypothetical protein
VYNRSLSSHIKDSETEWTVFGLRHSVIGFDNTERDVGLVEDRSGKAEKDYGPGGSASASPVAEF